MKVFPNHFQGGSNQQKGHGTPGADLATIVRGLVTDIGALGTAVNDGLNIVTADPTAVSAGAIGAFTDPPTAGEMSTLRTLTNELRTTTIENRALAIAVKVALNGIVVGSVTSPDPAAIAAPATAAFTDPPSAAEMGLLRTLVNEIRTTAIATRTLTIELKSDANAATSGTAPAQTVTLG